MPYRSLYSPPNQPRDDEWGCRAGSEVRRGLGPILPLIPRTEGLADSFSQGLERWCTVSSSILHGIEPRLKDFHQLLLSPPKVEASPAAGERRCAQGGSTEGPRCIQDTRPHPSPLFPGSHH